MTVRLLAIGAAFLFSIAALVPTVAPSFEAPWLFTSAIRTDLPFSTGLRLVLNADTDQVVYDEVSRMSTDLRYQSEADGLQLDVSAPLGISTVQVRSDANPKKVRAYLRTHLPAFVYEGSKGGTYRFSMLKVHQEAIGEGAVRSVTHTFEDMRRAHCHETTIVERTGERSITIWSDSGRFMAYDDCHRFIQRKAVVWKGGDRRLR